MNLLGMVRRCSPPRPWAEGEKIPWHELSFSERMLAEHLSQEHDAASRRFSIIDKHVEWIHRELLSGRSTKILDLCCGPGLYTSRLGKLGHECVGIDYSPAAIAYAKEQAGRESLAYTYVHEDVRKAEYGSGFGLAMLIFGEFNVFPRADARRILEKAREALADDGMVVLEPHTFDAVRGRGKEPASWYSSEGGLFSEEPHICLEEHFWDEGSRASTTRYIVVDAATGDATLHAASMQAYTDEEYAEMLRECGFEDVQFFPSLTGREDKSQDEFLVATARRHSAVR